MQHGTLKHAQGAGGKYGVSFSGANKPIQGADMAVTSPLAPLSPLGAVDRGNLRTAVSIYMTTHPHECGSCNTNCLKYRTEQIWLLRMSSAVCPSRLKRSAFTRQLPFLTFTDWSALAPSSCIALQQWGGGLLVFNSISGYPCCCCCSFGRLTAATSISVPAESS